MALAIAVLACGSLPAKAQPFIGNSAPASAAPPVPGEPQSLLPPPATNLAAPGASDVLRPPAPIPLPVAPLPPPPQVERPPATAAVPPPAPALAPAVPPGQVPLYLSARFGRDLPQVPGGIQWRVFPDRADATGAIRPIREDKTAAPTLMLPPGGYIVHATLGHAHSLKKVQLRAEAVRETFDIPAGGIRIEGKVGETRIPAGQIHFDIYKGSQFEPGDKRPISQNVVTGEVMLVPEGTYHIVSHYGDGNAVVRSDIRVQAARVTDVTVNHRAAVITLKLVTSSGGEAIANTQWSVLTPGGDVIKESIGAFPRVVLAEGEYRVIARNEGRSFQHDFNVSPGVDREISVVAR
ncbi:hypothetical protein [Pseudorhodoplanes sp.]|uniref:hypothetical protein n=1 Tax=Pseudorhodoplanes sp. TaxID=1934341 RepID=UPI002C77E145|nr:hypothetical protein [Pseudorhodoplanes sp.]HWV54532.1 hypothetical protein [Pseudorhodoplanes sp.]